MLSGDGNENDIKKKTRISPNWQKSNFARGANFFCTFLCLCFVRLQRGTSRNFLVTRFMVTRFMVTRFLFFVAHFHPGGRSNSHFLTAATKFHVVSTTEKGLLCFFLSRSSSFSRSASLGVALLSLFFCLSLSLYSKFVDMTINLSLILKGTVSRYCACTKL